MTPTMLRQLWSAIENSQAHLLLKLDDASLVQWLVEAAEHGSSARRGGSRYDR